MSGSMMGIWTAVSLLCNVLMILNSVNSVRCCGLSLWPDYTSFLINFDHKGRGRPKDRLFTPTLGANGCVRSLD